MNTETSSRKDIYFTHDHEWIDFQGAVAYIGVCNFKLTGFREIHDLKFHEASGFKKRGKVIAIVKYNDYKIEVHMPVDGKIVKLNDDLLSGNKEYAAASTRK